MARIFFDLSDLYDHFIVADGATGIQRVVIEVGAVAAETGARFLAYSHAFRSLLEVPAGLMTDRARGLAAFRRGDPGWPERQGFTRPSLKGVSGLVIAGRIVRSRLEWALLAVLRVFGADKRAMGQPVALEPGDVVVILGLPNNRLTALDRYAALSRKGVRVFVFCHDALPITHPEFFEGVGRLQYRAYFTRAVKAASALIANSQATAADCLKVIASSGLPPRPVHVAPLAHEFLGQPSHLETVADTAPKDTRLAALAGTPFLLCVGTLEVRKNHLRLLEAYKALCDRHGATSLPKLVIVGREGWKIGPYKDFMAETGAVGGQVVTLGGLSDHDLVWLYRHCLFSVFVSLAEGWGLPAGESAWFGKVCLTSDRSSMPEVLGQAGQYCDPTSEASIAAGLERLIFDKSAFHDAQAKILAMPLRSWRNVARDILSLIDTDAGKAPSP